VDDGCDDDKLRNLAVKLRVDSRNPQTVAAIDLEFDYCLTTATDCFVPTVNALLGLLVDAGQLLIESGDVREDLCWPHVTGRMNDDERGESYWE
jgi:hypothetical protein